MKKPMVSLDRLPEVLQQSQGVLDTLSRYRALLGQPEVTGTECEEYAKTIIGAMEKSKSSFVPVVPASKLKPKAPKPAVPAPKRVVAAKVALASSISERVAAGRQAVMRGDRPKLLDAIKIVMGDETLSSPEVLQRLKEKEWAPGASNQQSYISYMLSDNREIFTRVRRGKYKVGPTPEATSPDLRGLKPMAPSALARLLEDRVHFPTKKSILRMAPSVVRKGIGVKDSRARAVKLILSNLQALPQQRMLAFQADVVTQTTLLAPEKK